jgi:hypothetical protein
VSAKVVAPPSVVVMTDVAGVQHFVTDDAAVRGRRTGCYPGVCGRQVVAASLTAPDGTACPSCRTWADRWRR